MPNSIQTSATIGWNGAGIKLITISQVEMNFFNYSLSETSQYTGLHLSLFYANSSASFKILLAIIILFSFLRNR